MTLEQLRDRLVRESGRLELDDEAPDGTKYADLHINAGSKYLDLIQEKSLEPGNFRGILHANEISPEIPRCRAIEEVYVLKENSWVRIRKLQPAELVERYPQVDRTPVSFPLYWTPMKLSKVGTTAFPESFSLFNTSYQYYTLSLLPAAREESEMSVFGRFYSEDLIDDGDTNFWSTNHGELLLLASLRNVESFNRNQSGVRDYEQFMRPLLQGIVNSLAYQSIDGPVSSPRIRG